MKKELTVGNLIAVAILVFFIGMFWTGCGNIEKGAVMAPDVSSNNAEAPPVRLTYIAVDIQPPVTTIVYPQTGQSVPSSPVRITANGYSTDNVRVVQVKASLKNITANSYWGGSVWQSGYTEYGIPITPSNYVVWGDYFPPLPAQSSFSYRVYAIDKAGNVENPGAVVSYFYTQ